MVLEGRGEGDPLPAAHNPADDIDPAILKAMDPQGEGDLWPKHLKFY